MAERIDPYAVLQVLPTAHQEVVQAAYRALARLYHPDHNGGADDARRMVELNKAWRMVGTPAKRSAYDATAAMFGVGIVAASAETDTSAPRAPHKPPRDASVASVRHGSRAPSAMEPRVPAPAPAPETPRSPAVRSRASATTQTRAVLAERPAERPAAKKARARTAASDRPATARSKPARSTVTDTFAPAGTATATPATATPATGGRPDPARPNAGASGSNRPHGSNGQDGPNDSSAGFTAWAAAPAPDRPSLATDHAGPPPGNPVGSVLDFGRYQGWSLGEIARADRNYLEWFRRMPIGRRYQTEIEDLLDASLAPIVAPSSVSTPLRVRRGWLGRRR